MQIRIQSQRPVAPLVEKPPGGEPPPPSSHVDFPILTGAGYTLAGGAGGAVLGTLGGMALTRLTGNPAFTSAAPLCGATAGSISGLVASQSRDAEIIGRLAGSWVLATAGMAAGMSVGGPLGSFLSSQGSWAVLGQSGATLGALTGASGGAALGFLGRSGKPGEWVKSGATIGLGASLGLASGGLMQAAAHLVAPQAAYLLQAAPAVAAAAGAATGLHAYHRWGEATPSPAAEKRVGLVSAGTLGAVPGLAVGALVAGVAQVAGGSALYPMLAPSLGATVGFLTGAAIQRNPLAGGVGGRPTAWGHSASLLALSGAGAVAGDCLGHMLAQVSGNSLYAHLGAGVGLANGALAGLHAWGDGKLHRVTRVPLGTVGGATAGTVFGYFGGRVLDSWTGSSLYEHVGPIVLGLAGGLLGAREALVEDRPSGP